MTRPPHARSAVLQAAEKIVMDHGAANLTYDELVRVSGITRGGITYHFPTKESLLQALIENDLDQWHACVARKRPQYQGPNAELMANLDSDTELDPQATRLIAGLLGATMSSKALMQPWKDEYQSYHKQVCRASADPVLATLLSMAAEGLFMQETLGVSALTPSERQQLVQRMLELARGIGAQADETRGPKT